MRGRSGARDFSRVIVVSELGRNNGITSGARLHLAALRKLGVEAGLLDVTLVLRNHQFWSRYVPASACIFHADGPQTAALIRSVLPNATLAGLPDRPRGLGAAGSAARLVRALRPRRLRGVDAERLRTR